MTRQKISSIYKVYKLILLIVFLFSLFTVTIKPNKVHAQADIDACIAAGNTPAECAQQAAPAGVFDPFEGPTEETFDFLNPLNLGTRAALLSTPGGILTQVLIFAFPLGGLILFIMLVWGGFEILLGGANKKYVDSGKQRITAAFVGFFLLFSSYWITQIVEVIFGVAIL